MCVRLHGWAVEPGGKNDGKKTGEKNNKNIKNMETLKMRASELFCDFIYYFTHYL